MSYIRPYLNGVQHPLLSTNSISAITSTVSSGGTLALSNLSNQNQVVTGTTTHIIRLPTESTLVQGQSFVITNNSTGLVTVNSSAGNVVAILHPGTTNTLKCINNTVTSFAAWTGGNVTTYVVGSGSRGICFDGANVWVANNGSGNVTKINVATGAIVGTYAVTGAPWGATFDGTNIWIANFGVGTVTKLDGSTGAIIGTYPTAGPNSRNITYDGKHVYCTSQNAAVVKLLASTGAAVASFGLTSNNYQTVFDGVNMWVQELQNWGGLYKFNRETGAVLASYSTAGNPLNMCFDGTNIWLAIGGSVLKFLASSGTLLGTFAIGSFSGSICFDGENIWVIGDAVTKLRASDGTNLGKYPMQTNWVGGICFDGSNIWVATGSNTVIKIAQPNPQTPSNTIQTSPIGVPMLSTFSNVQRDVNANARINNITHGFQTTITNANTTVMSPLSGYLQYFTGVTTHTVLLPDVATTRAGTEYKLVNLSRGAVSVQNSVGSAITTLNPVGTVGSWGIFTCVENVYSTAVITNVLGGNPPTYFANNTFIPGQSVIVTGVNPSQYNVTNATITSVDPAQFGVNQNITGTYVSGGLATVTAWTYVTGGTSPTAVVALNTPNNTNAAAAGVGIGGLYRSNFNSSRIPVTSGVSIVFGSPATTATITVTGTPLISGTLLTGNTNIQQGTYITTQVSGIVGGTGVYNVSVPIVANTNGATVTTAGYILITNPDIVYIRTV